MRLSAGLLRRNRSFFRRLLSFRSSTATGAEALVRFHLLLVHRLGAFVLEGCARRNDPVLIFHFAAVAGANVDAARVDSLSSFTLGQVGLGIDCALRCQLLARLFAGGVLAYDDCLGFLIALQAKRDIVQRGFRFVVHVRGVLLELDLIELARFWSGRRNFYVHVGVPSSGQPTIVGASSVNGNRTSLHAGGVQGGATFIAGNLAG